MLKFIFLPFIYTKLSSVIAEADFLQECKSQVKDQGIAVSCWNLQNQTELVDSWRGLTITELSLNGCDHLNQSELSWTFLDSLVHLHLVNCQNGTKIFRNFQDLKKLKSLTMKQSSLEEFEYICDSLQKLETLDLSENFLAKFTLHENCKNQETSLRKFNLSHNSFSEFDWENLHKFTNLQSLDLSFNKDLQSLIPSTSIFSKLESLDLSHNPQLDSICSGIFHSIPNITDLELAGTNLATIPLQLYKLDPDRDIPDCSCDLVGADVGDVTSCSHGQSTLSLEDIIQHYNCTPAEIIDSTNHTIVFAGDSITLDCQMSSSSPSATIIWLTPRLDLIKYSPDIAGDCPGVTEEVSLCDQLCESNDYMSWPGHFTVLDNGSLVIDQFGWRDRGDYTCYLDNILANHTVEVTTELDYHYRHVIYMWSLLYGLVTAVGFLALTLLCKLIHHIAWNYGCVCGCCGCNAEPPPKIKRLTAAMESIEQYRIGQLEKLRENYTQQSQRIRDNYTYQLEKIRETYTSQRKDEGVAGERGTIKEQYWENVTRARDYSNQQLTKLHENYIFQRQRLRKFSVQNYVKIRETGKYTQKTLNRVIENIPTLTEITNCRQGGPDWDDEDDEDPPQMELMMMMREENSSLYFTPSGTPLREVASPPSDSNCTSPVHGANNYGIKDKRKSHKRMVSNLSNFLPFWWGMGQDLETSTTTTTVAIIENGGQSQAKTREEAVVGEETLHLVINTESSDVTTNTSEISITNSEQVSQSS